MNPAVRKTVGCVRSEILMDFLFLLFRSNFRELRKDDFSGTTQCGDGDDKDPTD